MNLRRKLKLRKIKRDVKNVLTHKVRVGFLAVPLWLLASMLVVRQLRHHRSAA